MVNTTPTANTTGRNVFDVLDDPLLRNITSYLPNEDLMKVARVSKHFNEMIPRATTYESRAPGTIITVLQLSPSKKTGGNYGGGRGRLDQLVHQLKEHNPNLLERYQHASMKDYHEFQFNKDNTVPSNSHEKYKDLLFQIRLQRGPRIEGITSLDFCFSALSPSPTHLKEELFGLMTLPYLLPSLREVNFTNTRATGRAVQTFCERCPRLEKITFHNNQAVQQCFLRTYYPPADGSTMMRAKSLKEVYMDNSTLFLLDDSEFDVMSDLEENDDEYYLSGTRVKLGVRSKMCLFHKCGTVLERVSLRNSEFLVVTLNGSEWTAKTIVAIPRNALIKYIRNAPTTLRWFRSDLTTENIQMLHHERPEIEFVS